MKSAPSDQQFLLDVASLDMRIERAEQARKNPPQAGRVNELIAQRNEQGRALIDRTNARDEVKTELARVESDIDIAKKRQERDRQRLGQTAIARDAQALESEIDALAARIDGLETSELELMESLQAAEKAVVEQQAALDETTAEGQRVSGEGKAAMQALVDELEALKRDRGAVVSRLPEQLFADYMRIAKRTTGAALFQHGTCGGCHMALSRSDLAVLKGTADDEVAHCPECGCILVRTAESGL
ncbi:zinc ribbon domain-containing protein [Microbacterium sp. G2-8]|uniref:zinc ribbon domain-containing protein n=1 Tax=Microbacterium sp. G2-8 TaxID=2842454 RepID=UPI001C8A9831|nr:C4-type zinc ribbon domain-containing protein [Microbacterium sp. G2-8]